MGIAMKNFIQKEIFENGNLVKIEVVDGESSSHVFDILWDPHDEQTPENREAFRRWAQTMIKRKEQQNGN